MDRMKRVGRRRTAWRRAMWLVVLVLLVGVAARGDEPYARSRDYDLQNSRLELRFDTTNRKIMGTVTHTLAPLHDGLKQVEFDSVNLTISGVTVGGKPVRYEATGGKLRVELPAAPKTGQALNVQIRYEGQPRQGMYFILPDKNYPTRPVQIWSQGESKETRHFVPIYDYPNDLTTSETLITVPKTWTTLSNGRLVKVRDTADGMKTWTWRQAQPHATYLISVVAGEFDESKDTWRNIPVTYYVPRGRAERIPTTFSHTKSMLDYFSERFGVLYPWDKYAQIAVEEHFGGMEHTSATTLAADSLVNPKLAPEYHDPADGLVAHELAHQWFGDLVTCKDWGDMWLNEGFASYAEELWDEKLYGKEMVEFDIWNRRNQWLLGQRAYPLPLVNRGFKDISENFANIYGKAAVVIHMLRLELGDADFFRGLKHYLQKNRHQNVSAADLARAFEEATGKNVDLFFDLWVYGAGAPKFEISYTYDPAAKQVKMDVKQAQKVEGRVGLFNVPVEVEVTTAEARKSYPIRVSQASQSFTFPAGSKPLMVLFDKGNKVLKAMEFPKGADELNYQLRNAVSVADRLDAARALGDPKHGDAGVAELGEAARTDKFRGVRSEAVRSLGKIGGAAAQKQIATALADPEPVVRQLVVQQMGNFKEDPSVPGQLEKVYRDEKTYRVRAAALAALAQQKGTNAFDVLKAAAATESPDDTLRAAALRGMGTLGDDHAAPILLEWSAAGKPFTVRAAAIGSLGNVDKKNPAVTKTLAAYLEEPYRQVQFSTILALGRRGDPEAVPALEALIKRSQEVEGGGFTSGQVASFAQAQVARLKQVAAAEKK